MKRFKIITKKEKLSDKEIEQQMNFDKFISNYSPSSAGSSAGSSAKWFAKSGKMYTLIASISAVVITSSVLIYNSSTKKENALAETPFVNPPIKPMDIANDAFNINASKDTTIVCKNGSFISIPANVFVDEKGSNITGEIKIKYREFHDIIDICLSGIPMNYDSAGNHYQFESAGMFEITAFKNEKPVFISPGKQLQVNLISQTNNADDYNLYYLDTVKKQWVYKGENTTKSKTCFPAFEPNPEIKNFNDEFQLLESSIEPIMPKKSNANNFSFAIDYKKDEFPELSVFDGIKFEPIKPNTSFYTSLSKQTWEDVFIEKNKTTYIITFAKENQKHKIEAIPVIEGKEFDSKIKDYELLVNQKKKSIQAKKDSLYRINSTYKWLAMKSNLNERFNNFIDGSYNETSKDLLVFRAFNITSLGIHNSDRPFYFFTKRDELKFYDAKFFVNTIENTEIKAVYIYKDGLNAVYSLTENQLRAFPFNSEVTKIIAVTFDGQLLYCQNEGLKNVAINDNTIRFKLKEVDNSITTPQQLKQLLKMQI